MGQISGYRTPKGQYPLLHELLGDLFHKRQENIKMFNIREVQSQALTANFFFVLMENIDPNEN